MGHPDDPTLTKELLEKIEDGRSAPLKERIHPIWEKPYGSNFLRLVDPRDPDAGAYCDDVCIVGPILLRRAVERIRELEHSNEALVKVERERNEWKKRAQAQKDLSWENARLREALDNVLLAGHNNDSAREAAGELLEELKR